MRPSTGERPWIDMPLGGPALMVDNGKIVMLGALGLL